MTRLQHLLSTLHVVGCPTPRKTRFRLVVSLCREGVEPSGYKRRFQLHCIPLPQALPVAHSLFVGSLEAGERYAALLTLAVNCALSGANPFLYFTDVFDRLAAGWPNARAADLMPQAWLAAQQKTEKVESEAGLGVIHD